MHRRLAFLQHCDLSVTDASSAIDGLEVTLRRLSSSDGSYTGGSTMYAHAWADSGTSIGFNLPEFGKLNLLGSAELLKLSTGHILFDKGLIKSMTAGVRV